MNYRPIILFEPIARGSRLQILANMVSAIRSTSSRKIVIITRSDYYNDHFYEVMGNNLIDVEIIKVAMDLNGVWTKVLTASEFSVFLDAMFFIVSQQSYDVVFMALDEYLIPFVRRSVEIRHRLVGCRIWIVKYRVEYLFKYSSHVVRSLILDFLTRFALFASHGTLVCFDERLSGFLIDGRSVNILPDPWFGDYSPNQRLMGRERYGFNDDDFVILALGRQDRRKGIHLIIAAADDLLKIPGSLLFIVGNIDNDFLYSFGQILAKHGDRVRHINKFVDEATLPLIFACADVFLLPYSKNFTSSSGTLPRAAASGVPVITGVHGLIGHRVRQYGLGETFSIDDVASLVNAATRVSVYSTLRRGVVQSTLLTFAESVSLPQFKKRIGELFL